MPKRKLPRSHLAHAVYAERTGINPLAFEGGYVDGLFQDQSDCGGVWSRFTWQSDSNASRHDLAVQIIDAERVIGDEILGFNVAPEWVELEMEYPAYRQHNGMRGTTHRYKTINLQQGEIISGGRRATQLIGNFPITYEDLDGDQFKETATIDLGGEYNWNEVKVYHPGTAADPDWEIRPVREIDKQNYILSFDSWLFADPVKTSALPGSEQPKLDLANPSNLVETVDVYLEYNDTESPSVEFIWNSQTGDLIQDGFLEVVDGSAGVVRPVPAVYSSDLSCPIVLEVPFCYAGQPDRVKMYFYAGYRSREFVSGRTTDPLDSVLAESIRLLSTARLDRDLCGCTNVIAVGRDLRTDMSLVSPQGNFLAVADAIQECPFGTRRGEWLAWKRIGIFSEKFYSVALV